MPFFMEREGGPEERSRISTMQRQATTHIPPNGTSLQGTTMERATILGERLCLTTRPKEGRSRGYKAGSRVQKKKEGNGLTGIYN